MGEHAASAEDVRVCPADPCPPADHRRFSTAERLARVDPIMALVIRDLGWPPNHPAAADLDLLMAEPPGVIALQPAVDMRIWIVLDGCPRGVREATRRLSASPLPRGVTRIRVH